MNVVVGLIIATLVIAAMIAMQVISFESVLKERLKAGRSDACDERPCFGGCGSHKSTTATGPVRDGDRAKRSTSHAS